MINKNIYIYSFYRFKKIKNIKYTRKILKNASEKNTIYGTVLIANEGVNGTISGKKFDLDLFIKSLKNILKIRKLSLKISSNSFIPFYKFKIKAKKEIVTIGNKFIKPEKITGNYVHPKSWDRVVNNKKFLLIDTRNEYEVEIGSFKNSINPKMNSFREFPKFIENQNIDKFQPIAMFCTGGIRCEKASSYMIEKGYRAVYQLDGGILNYLEFKKNKKKQTWNGECFVFDNRVSVKKDLKKGSYDQCHGCRRPITKKDKESKKYIKGVSCPKCFKNRTLEQKKKSLSRQNQIDHAENKKISHAFKKITLLDI